MSDFKTTLDSQLIANVLLQLADQDPFAPGWGLWNLKGLDLVCIYSKDPCGPASIGLEPESNRIRSTLQKEGLNELAFAISQQPTYDGYTYVALLEADCDRSCWVWMTLKRAVEETARWMTRDLPPSSDLPATSGSRIPSAALHQGMTSKAIRKPGTTIDWQLVATVLVELAQHCSLSEERRVLYFNDPEFLCVVSHHPCDQVSLGQYREPDEIRDLLLEQGIDELAFAEYVDSNDETDCTYLMLLDAGHDQLLTAWGALGMAAAETAWQVRNALEESSDEPVTSAVPVVIDAWKAASETPRN